MAFTRLIALQLFGIILFLFVGIAEPSGESGYNSNNDYYASKAQSGEYEVSYGHSARLIDDYVCDLDASILMVTNSEKSYQKVNNYGKSKGAGKNYGEEKPMGPPKGGAAGSYGPGPQETAAGNYGPPQPAHHHQPEYPAAKRAKRDAPDYGYGGGQEEGGEYHHSPEQEEEGNNNYGGPYGPKSEGEGYGGKKKTSGSYGGGGSYTVAKAHRLRCSAIAVNSDEDCKKCCHMAARKERSIPKDSIVGFIVDYDEVRQPSTGYQPSGPYRAKRETAAIVGEEQVYPPAVMPEGKYEKPAGDSAAGEYASQGGSAAPTGYGANNYQQQQPPHQNYYNYPTKPKNPRCVCCAPKTHSGSGYQQQQQQQSGYGSSSGYGNKRNNDNNGYYGGPKPRAFPKKPHNYGGSGEQYHGQKYGEEEQGGEYQQQQQPHGHGYGREGDYAAGGPSAPSPSNQQQYNNNQHQHKYHARRPHQQQDYNQAEAEGEEYGQNNNESGEHEQEVAASEYAVEHKQQQYGGQKQPKQQYGNGKQYGKMKKGYASAEREY